MNLPKTLQHAISFIITMYIVGCAQLPSRESIKPSYAIPPDLPSPLRESLKANKSNLSGFYPLSNGVDAFAARLALIEAAQHSIDVQYYLYHREHTTFLLTAKLLAAADRGVRVRLLLDDLSQSASSRDLATLSSHPQIEVRLFNPFAHRRFRALGFIGNYRQLSRRMHNKSFIVDNQAFITGGRNIGNEYFSVETHTNFADLDVLCVGNIVPQASGAFDLYWNHQLAYPIELLQGYTHSEPLAKMKHTLRTYLEQNSQSRYVQRLRDSDIIKKIEANQLDFDWQPSRLFYDHPDKLLNQVTEKSANMSSSLFQKMAQPHKKVIIVSPYFVPKEQGVKMLTDWAQQDVDITVLTNSLAATDVAAVHAGYGKYRKPLLEAGIKIWEFKPDYQNDKDRGPAKSPTGSSQASLHAKTLTFDDQQIFIGSMNLDPRSFDLNTELGVLIQSEKMSRSLATWVEEEMPTYAWKVALDNTNNNALYWLDTRNNQRFDEEPQTTYWQRLLVWCLSILPIEDEL